MEPSPWEALDIDDSDLHSLLRPCNRRSRQTDSHSLSSSQPHHPTLAPNPNFSHSLQPPQFQPPPPPETQFVIPGPAGAVQAAMHRKARANCRDGPAMPTQEYIRRAVEEGQEDDDFDRHPWLSALQFLGPQDIVDSGLPSTPLSSIKKCPNIGRVDQVVAVIKSCIPNGLGGLMVTLKDPTGTINASVHHKALVEVEFANKISVGSVLILRKVVVFAPSISSHYLNMTPSNIVKVISKDSSPPIKPNYLVSATKPAALASECRRETDGTEMVSSSEQDRTEALVDDAHKLREKRNHLSHGNPCIRTSRREDQSENAGCLMRQNAAEEIIKRAVRTDGMDCDQRGLDIGKKVQEAVCSSSRLQNVGPVANLDENQNRQQICRANEPQNQKQPLMSRATLPEWTDEQLNELFAADAEDDESLF
ncbi:uncharacterized protein LOC127794153 [Diospyros lotus]|uniref:uncharacterized protein LOC127794153 n=1 Tax=Diospyros lotus TaxID=55363 RepID=UPI00224D48AA|nr:uncharacterized protein LOC127794153 [Diospyros lotus]